jgi:hypothetical protein
MEKKPKALRRGLFGVRAGDVQQVLADRDVTALTAAEQVRSAEERASASEARAAALEARLAEVTQAGAGREPDAPDSADPHDLLLAMREEMARVMLATQEAGSKILEHTRSGVEQQLEDSDRRRREIEDDKERLEAWVGDVKQSAAGLRQSITEAAGAINRTMGAMQETERALATMVGRMADTDAFLHKGPAPKGTLDPTATPPEHAPTETVAAGGPDNGLHAPEPPVDVSSSPAAESSPHAEAHADVSHLDSDEELASSEGAEAYGQDASERALATSWSAGPSGKRPPAITGD